LAPGAPTPAKDLARRAQRTAVVVKSTIAACRDTNPIPEIRDRGGYENIVGAGAAAGLPVPVAAPACDLAGRAQRARVIGAPAHGHPIREARNLDGIDRRRHYGIGAELAFRATAPAKDSARRADRAAVSLAGAHGHGVREARDLDGGGRRLY